MALIPILYSEVGRGGEVLYRGMETGLVKNHY
jgi:hypothetical protein